jgi:hypothetical protein
MPSRMRRINAACVVLIAGSVAGAVATVLQTEAIIVAGPLLGVFSLGLGVVAIRIGSPALFGLAMIQSGSTGSLASLIFLNGWGPDEAAVPAILHFFVAAAACFGWGSFTMARLRLEPAAAPDDRRPLIPRFTLRTLLAITTWLCVFLTLCCVLDWDGDYAAFAMYSLTMATAIIWLAIAYGTTIAAPTPTAAHPWASD